MSITFLNYFFQHPLTGFQPQSVKSYICNFEQLIYYFSIYYHTFCFLHFYKIDPTKKGVKIVFNFSTPLNFHQSG